MLNEVTKKVKDLVSEGDTEKALKLLANYFSESKNLKMQKIVVLLSSRLNKLKSEELSGTIDPKERTLKTNQINSAILNLLEPLDPPIPTKKVEHLTLIPILIVLTVLIIAFLLYKNFFTINELPLIALVDPIVNINSKIFLVAEDSTFQISKKLNLEFEGLKFLNSVVPLSGYTQQYWYFNLNDKNIPNSMLKEGVKTLSISYPNAKDKVTLKIYLSDTIQSNFNIPMLANPIYFSSADSLSKIDIYYEIITFTRKYFKSRGVRRFNLLEKDNLLRFEVITQGEILNRDVSSAIKTFIGKDGQPIELISFTFLIDPQKKLIELDIQAKLASGILNKVIPSRNAFINMEPTYTSEFVNYVNIWKNKFKFE